MIDGEGDSFPVPTDCEKCGAPVQVAWGRRSVSDLTPVPRTAYRWVVLCRWQCLRVEGHRGMVIGYGDDDDWDALRRSTTHTP